MQSEIGNAGNGPAESRDEPLLTVTDLKKYFPVRKGLLRKVVAQVKAVDGISFTLGRKETLGLVGESGCGKTTAGRSILRLIEPTGGRIVFRGRDILGLSTEELRLERRHMQIIFQDPYSSLNPRMTAGAIVGEALTIHRIARGREQRDRVRGLLERVGLEAGHMDRYPHEFSGGQRQRIGIARAIALNPDFIVCDEAVSALDVSIQAQVINLLAGPPGGIRPQLPLHRARPGRRQVHQRPRRGDVHRQDRRDGLQRGAFRTTRCTRTRWRCSRRCPCRTRRRSASGSSWRAACPAR